MDTGPCSTYPSLSPSQPVAGGAAVVVVGAVMEVVDEGLTDVLAVGVDSSAHAPSVIESTRSRVSRRRISAGYFTVRVGPSDRRSGLKVLSPPPMLETWLGT
jgi:hypothetical protein